MTRKEITNNRDLNFNNWIRDNLPDSSTGFTVVDVDFVLYNYKTRKCMLIEVKTRNGSVTYNQRKIIQKLDKWLHDGIEKGWHYLGYHLIIFENTCPDDGKIFLNHDLVTKEELIKALSI